MSAYGVVVEVTTNSKLAAREIRSTLTRDIPRCSFLATKLPSEHRYRYVWNASGKDTIYKNGEVLAKRAKRNDLLDALASSVRIAIAEFAVDRVFIHAGVVGWKGKAILIPAKSFQGKSTLTAELVSLGARYYSDEYAVLDSRGLVHPFAKPLSLREGKVDFKQTHRPVENFGGVAGKRPIPLGLVVITEYRPNAKWKPNALSLGVGLMELIKHTVPIRYKPGFVLPVLDKASEGVMFIRTLRGEASEVAPLILALAGQDPWRKNVGLISSGK